MNKRYWTALLIGFVALELILTFWQNYQFPFDGDLVPIVFPAPWYGQVLHDPFGWAVLTRNEVYAATNRFFAHATMVLYWKQVPRLLQHVVSPISSLYAASALFNTGTQALILFILAAYVRRSAGLGPGRWGFWVAAAVLAPLFQTDGFYEQMGITNQAITYTFFYAFPVALILILMWPLFQAAHKGQPFRLHPLRMLLLVLLMVVIAFNGPIAAAAIAVLLALIGLFWVWLQWQKKTGRTPQSVWLSGQALLLLAIIGGLSVYSLYIGRNNAENTNTHTLWELYQLLPTGFYLEITKQWGLPLLLLFVVVNTQLVRYLTPPSAERQWVLHSIRWVGAFAVLYILLLPFGGYRDYRPYVIRGDSVLPVLIALFYTYGLTTCFLLTRLQGRPRFGYASCVVLVAAGFIYVDSDTTMAHTNDCERWALEQMAQSKEPVVEVSPHCNVMSWGPIPDYHSTEMHADLLYYWGVTPSRKLFQQ